MQLDLFPTSEPEIKGQLAAFAVVLRGLIEALIANGQLTPQQAASIIRHADLKTAYAIWDSLQGEMPDAELRRMEAQAERFLSTLRNGNNILDQPRKRRAMKNTHTCPKCNSQEIMRIEGRIGGYSGGNDIAGTAGPFSFRTVKVTRYLCGSCGFSEEWIDEPEDLHKLKEKYGSS